MKQQERMKLSEAHIIMLAPLNVYGKINFTNNLRPLSFVVQHGDDFFLRKAQYVKNNENYAFCAAAICRGCYVHIHVINLSTCCPGRLVCGHDIASKRTSLNVSVEKNDLDALVAGTIVLEHFPTRMSITWSVSGGLDNWRQQTSGANTRLLLLVVVVVVVVILSTASTHQLRRLFEL
ncbi:hypothetical protein T11_10234 [Trichinella zimbabwensis]|uniref:Uncharacterized protein n=1 Tax=Trichinella zimbabwensis TaxID=268475 RepID=A0A0V1GZL6_9BILA|nr:hypothetical protein T11_10234 [Trichinella zimbabwensis]